jgi:hypothetical protein
MSERPLGFLDQGFGQYTEEELMDRLLEAAQYSDEHYNYVNAEAQSLAMVLRKKVRICGGERNALFNRALIDNYVTTERTVHGVKVFDTKVEKECVDKGACQQRDGVWVPWNINWHDRRYAEPACYLDSLETQLDDEFAFTNSQTRYFWIGWVATTEYDWVREKWVFGGFWGLRPFGRVGDSPLFSLSYPYPGDLIQDPDINKPYSSDSFPAYVKRKGMMRLDSSSTGKTAEQIEKLLVSASKDSVTALAALANITQKELEREWDSYFKAGAHPVHLDNWRLQQMLKRASTVGAIITARKLWEKGLSDRDPLGTPPNVSVRYPNDINETLFNRPHRTYKQLIFGLTTYSWKSNREIDNASGGVFKNPEDIKAYFSEQAIEARKEEARQLASERLAERNSGLRQVSDDVIVPGRGGIKDNTDPSETVQEDLLSRMSGELVPEIEQNKYKKRSRNALVLSSAAAFGGLLYMGYRRNR